MKIEKRKDSLIKLRIILKEMEKTEAIERLKTEKH